MKKRNNKKVKTLVKLDDNAQITIDLSANTEGLTFTDEHKKIIRLAALFNQIDGLDKDNVEDFLSDFEDFWTKNSNNSFFRYMEVGIAKEFLKLRAEINLRNAIIKNISEQFKIGLFVDGSPYSF